MHVHIHIPACHSAMDEVHTHTHTLKGGGRAGKERGVLYGGGGVMTLRIPREF